MEEPRHAGQQGRGGRPGGLAPLGPRDPRRIGAYRLIGRLGEGGMGRVFLARSDRGRTVAVKLVRAELADEEEFRARFRREVRAAQQVGGEWTAPVLDADTEAETPWLATGYIAGPSLQQVVGGGPPLPERTVRILAAGLARALRSIHAAGIIHRDLKPSNVLVTIDGPRVIDFGIARALEGVAGNGVTRTGAAVGSPGFMSPEQVRGEPLGPACDVFSLGSVLAYAATGRQPFGTAESAAHALMFRVAEEEPDLTGVPEGLRGLISACLAKDPAQRPTPEHLVELAEDGVDAGPGADDEPWLPGALIARLGRHAVELLEAENPQAELARAEEEREQGTGAANEADPAHGPANGADPAAPSAPVRAADAPGIHALPTTVSPTPVPGRTPPPSPVPPSPYGAHGALPHGPTSYGPTSYAPHPAQAHHAHPVPAPVAPGPRRRGIGTALLAVVALALAGAGAATAYSMLTDRDDGVRAEDGRGDANGRTSAQSAATGGIPPDYLGTWEATVGDSGVDVRRFTLVQGKTGATVLTMTATGANYRCEFAATLASAGPPVRLGPSTVVSGPDGCHPGKSSTLEMVGGKLRRVSDDGRALLYRRTR
ncbi:serine/threonine-protein kinase [Streptomyces sp. MOE7]|uniref:serine/threonine-protein kinase n=1 Tax=Streptomyces sp. MOE7 TaxID=1961713 RepID=UPI0009FDB2C8|nr:serine/threonine-protein kinase [Streptomyces sp. MOE7]